MGRRREEKVDEEELARLMSSEEAEQTKIRVKMPTQKSTRCLLLQKISLAVGVSLYFALMAKPEWRDSWKMRRRQWVREGDLIIVWPWDFQDSKADVKHRYTKTRDLSFQKRCTSFRCRYIWHECHG